MIVLTIIDVEVMTKYDRTGIFSMATFIKTLPAPGFLPRKEDYEIRYAIFETETFHLSQFPAPLLCWKFTVNKTDL